jgi:hypothetical protein
MAIQINGNGTITGISVGGLPDGIVDTDMLAASAASPEKLGDGIVIQTSIVTTPNNVTVNSDGSYTDIITHNFTPKRSDSNLVYHLMFQCYLNNNVGYSNGVDYRILQDSTTIKEQHWANYLNNGSYTHDWYPQMNVIDRLANIGTTNQITFKMQGRRYQGSTNSFQTSFGEDTRSGSAVGNTIVWKIEELSV